VALDVDEHFEAMFIESQGPGEPDDAPDEVLDLAGTVTEEMPAGGAVGVAWEPPDVDPVPDVDWRATTMQRVLSAIDGPGMLSTIAPLEDELEIARIETVGDLCEFLTDEGGELADISPNPQYRAELCRALEVFRTSQGWDESTQYPAGIPAGWFEIEEDDLAAIAAETASRPSEWKELYRTPRLKKEPPPQPRIKPTRPAATGKKDREAKKVFGEVITAAMSAAAIRATGKTAPAPKAAGPAKKNNRDVPREVVLERLKTALEPKLAKWEKLRASGAVYTTLNRAILAHLGARSGADWSSIHAAGDELKFWATKSGAAAKKKPDLAGHLAVDASREILEIGLPDGPGATPAPGAGKKAPKVAAKHEPTITAAKDEDWKANGKASETRPSVLPPGNGEKPWTLDSLKSAADSLRWKASDKSMFVCDRCNSLYLADVWKKGDPGGGAPGNPRERCPQCDGGFCRTYATEEANIRERVASVGASKKASPATELLGDKSHGFKPVKTVGKVTLAQTAPPGSLNAELARALQLEHPYHGQVWAELHRTGATDAEILAQLKRLWPNAPVFTPAEKKAAPGGYTIQGGKTLGFWHGAKKSTNQEPLLAGPMLAKSVRSLLGIREKNASKQPGAKPRASGAQRRRSAKTASPAAHIDDVPEDPGPEIHEPVVVPEPIGGWNVPAMSTAAADILGKDHRESSRDAALVCCTSCQAMRRRGPGPCSECDAPGFRSYAALRAEVLGAGKRALDEAMASDRARDRGQRG
jgi:hypothetical protein